MRRLSLTALLLILSWGLVEAQDPWDDAAMQAPYHLRVVLQVDEHPLLTAQYIQQIREEIRDALQRDLGSSALVEVIRFDPSDPKQDPYMKEVVAGGWGALDNVHPITGQKIHLIRLEYQDGEYELQSRQVDGDTGYVSRLRRARTSDRMWVAREASLMVAKDFGLTASIGQVTGSTVRFRLRAGQHGQAESIRVRDGEIFAICRLYNDARQGQIMGSRVLDSFLFVTGVGSDGQCTGRLFSRQKDPFRRDRGVIGFRAIKLGTRRAPLYVRVTDLKTNEPIAGCEVQIYPGGYPSEQDVITRPPIKLGATDNTGRIRSTELFSHVAFARFQYGRFSVNIPVALFDDQAAEIKLVGSAEAEKYADFEYDLRPWISTVYEMRNRVQDVYERVVPELRQKGEGAKVLETLETLAKDIRTEVADLTTRLKPLEEKAKDAGPIAASKIKEAESHLKVLLDAAQRMEEYVKDERDPSPARKKFNEGRQEEDNLNFDKAITLYEEAIKMEKNPMFVSRLDRLKKAWSVKDAEHRTAREYITKYWPKRKWENLLDLMEDLEKHVEVLNKHGDYLGAQLLYKANVDHLTNMNNVLNALQTNSSDEDQQKAEQIEKTAEALRNLNRDMLDLIERSFQ